MLQRFLCDQLLRSEVGAVEDHVATCADCQQTLRRLIGSVPGSFVTLPDWDARTEDGDPPVLPGYELVARIDAGGMGVVWRVRDLEFQRLLAVKVMRAEVNTSPRAVRRFLDEARITGGLAHPFIVPVHTKGRLPDGRPYFTMKLVAGETLAARLRGRSGPAARQAELVRIFAQVCQAVAYAHACGVIHRDLKPANVMVGAFGEVQVMDWGLAKELSGNDGTERLRSAAGAAPGPVDPVDVAFSDPDHNTHPGAVLGTVAYMAPEQARGEVERLDPRCDVFSLGAILCEILTGAPPYGSGAHGGIHWQAAKGDLTDAFAELDACGADAELVRIAKVCLAPNREDRLADAGVVAAAVAAYEARAEERLLRAEVERAEAQVRAREERKRRRLASGAAAAVLVGLFGLAAGAVLLGQKNRQLVAANGELDSAHTEAVKKGEQAARARDRAFRVLDAMTSSATGESLETQPAITTEQKRFLTDVLSHYQEFASDQGEEETRERAAAAALRVGLINYRLGFHEASLRAFARGASGFEQLCTEFPTASRHRRALAESYTNLGLLLRELGQLTEAEAASRKALVLREKLAAEFPDPLHLRALAGCYNNLAVLLEEVPMRSAEVKETHRKALAIREKLATDCSSQPQYHQDLAASYNNLGAFLEQSCHWSEAGEAYRRALAIREKLAAEFRTVPEYRQDLAASLFNLGGLLRKVDECPRAEEVYRQALAICEKLAADFPAVPRYRQDLAASYNNLALLLVELRKRPDEIQECHRQALTIREKLAVEFPGATEYRRDLAATHIGLGTLLRKLDRRPRAEEAYRRALVILEQLVAEFPGDRRNRHDLAGAHNNLGRLFCERNKWPEAEEAYRKALAVREKLATEFRTVPEYRHALATSHFNLAELLGDLDGRLSEAKAAYRSAQAVWEPLAGEFPRVAEYRRDLAASYNNLGILFRKLDEPLEARAAYLRALALWEKLDSDFPGVSEHRIKLAAGQVNFGNLLSQDGEFTEALVWYDRAVAALTPRVQVEFDTTIDRQFLRTAHWGRAGALDALDRTAAAIADWDRAVELSPPQERPPVRATRARSLARAGQVERAVDEAGALAQSPAVPVPQLYTLACVYALAAGRDEANCEGHVRNSLRLLGRAVDQGFKDAEQLRTDDDLKPLRDHADFRKLLVKLENPPKKAQNEKEK
ncbi:Serine/threonine protein kinase [Frigoriglobus tundricola]|uniref:Serine/threonine protein kinase n=1 Tax=Frigoriglobus tundricola TaxID=2774151 RepID=A0A6M5YLT0_9BACT|nr:Serine/threonine protein kinase [Frigoriglobus tundricola]